MGRVETVTAIAKREGVTDRYVSQLIDLAFLGPKIVEQILSGEQHNGVSTRKLTFDIELDPRWSVQMRQIVQRANHSRLRRGESRVPTPGA